MTKRKIKLKVEPLLKDPYIMRYIEGFEVKKAKGLERYLKKHAVTDELTHMARTYLVRDAETGEIAAYFSLKAGMQTTNEYVDEIGNTTFDCVPGIELANWAINNNYKEKYNISAKIGAHVLKKYILPIVASISKSLGVSILFIYSLPEESLIEWYLNHGFSRLDKETEKKVHERIKPNYDENCIFMYMQMDTILNAIE